MKLPQSDQMLERIYDLVDRQPTEARRQEVIRIALVAAEHRAQQLKKEKPTHDGQK